ncbi:hypothetical protein JCM6882_002863 [Rhodosporidiobolus microsporus]
MSDEDFSDAYSFPSDEDAYFSDDDLVLDDSEDPNGDEAGGTAGQGEEAPLPLDLTAFRRDWLEQVDAVAATKARVNANPANLPGSAFSRLFSHPDVVDAILSSPALSPSDLSSLARTHSLFREPAQALLFRHTPISTLARATALSELFDVRPDLAGLVRSATLALGDPLEMARESGVVREKMAQQERREMSQAIEYYWTEGGKSVARREWEQDLLKQLRVGVDEEDPEGFDKARRNGHVVWALKKLPKQELEVLVTQMRAELFKWPVGPGRSPALHRLFDHLAPTLDSLTLAPPLSHHISALTSVLPSFTALRTLTIRGDPSCALRFRNPRSTADTLRHLKQIARLPAPAVALNTGSFGFRGAPPGVEKLVLESVMLYWEAGLTKSLVNSEKREWRDGWKLDELEMRRVVVKRAPTSWRSRPARAEQDDSEDDVDEAASTKQQAKSGAGAFASDPLLYLHLANFVSAHPAARLTSLVLVDVDGVVPSTIYLAIHSAGPALRHLTLENINLFTPSSSSSQPAEPPQPTETLTVDFPLTALPHTSSHTAARVAQRAQLVQLVARAAHWHRYDSASLPSSKLRLASAHATYWPSNTLPDALKRCTSLRTVKLDASLEKASNAPYPPAVLDALLEVRSPLEVVRLRIGAEGPTREEGFLDVEGWEEVGRKVAELGAWETVRKEECRVVVALRTSRI